MVKLKNVGLYNALSQISAHSQKTIDGTDITTEEEFILASQVLLLNDEDRVKLTMTILKHLGMLEMSEEEYISKASQLDEVFSKEVSVIYDSGAIDSISDFEIFKSNMVEYRAKKYKDIFGKNTVEDQYQLKVIEAFSNTELLTKYSDNAYAKALLDIENLMVKHGIDLDLYKKEQIELSRNLEKELEKIA